jgi:hypothetical protein
LPTTAPDGAVTGDAIRIKDYTKLDYKDPVSFGSTIYSARGDLLGYSPKVGIYFVREASGLLTVLTKKGEPVRNITEFESHTPLPNPVPPSYLFYCVDLQGNVYVSYPARRLIVKYAPDGRVLDKIKRPERPEALTVDEDGNLYVIYDSEIKKLEAVPIVPKSASPTPGASPKPKSSAKPTAAAPKAAAEKATPKPKASAAP